MWVASYPDKFEDRYEQALKALIRKKAGGEKIEAPERPKADNVVNLMDALRQSVQAEKGGGGKKAAAKPAPRRRATPSHSQRRATNEKARKAG